MIDLAILVALALMRRFEGLYLTPYLCPAGVPTIGYGATYYEDGTRVTLFDAAITHLRSSVGTALHIPALTLRRKLLFFSALPPRLKVKSIRAARRFGLSIPGHRRITVGR